MIEHPYRNPSPPHEHDFAVVVFRTDHRVIKHAQTKWEIALDADGNPTDPDAWRRALEAAYRLGREGHAPEVKWYREAQALAERVGRRWDETPIPTLVEALARREGQWPLGFSRTRLMPGQPSRVSTQPQIAFRGRRLVLGPPDVARRILVTDVKVGNFSCLVSCSPIDGALFASDAFPFWLKLQTAQVCQHVTLYLENVSDEPVDVTPTMHGDVIESVNPTSRRASSSPSIVGAGRGLSLVDNDASDPEHR
jgi:hypothetical protein